MPKQIVILPGIMGTNLLLPRADGFRSLVWYNPEWLAAIGPEALQLAPDGVSPGPLASGPLEVGGPVETGAYTPLIEALEAAGWRVFFCGYDWRLSLLANVPTVVAKMKAAFPAGDFHVVSHSMGGLIARLAYAGWGDAISRTRWKRTIYLGVPHGGSHSATGNLAGFSPGWSWATLYAQVMGWVRFLPVGRGIGTTNAISNSRAVLATWRGLACLMPQYDPPWAGMDTQAPNVYFTSPYFVGNPAVTQATLDAAVANHQALTAALAGPRPEELSVIGVGTETPDTFTVPLSIDTDLGYNFTRDGDGAVTYNRGHLPDRPRISIVGGHQDYLIDGQVLKRINEWEEGPLPPPSNKLERVPPGPGLIDPEIPIPAVPVLPWKNLQRIGDP